MKRSMLICVALVVSLSTVSCQKSLLDGNEVWRCSGIASGVDSIVLTRHLRNGRDKGTGTVQAARVTYNAFFSVDGVERRWNWYGDSYGGSYSFIINASGYGRFYDFSYRTKATPSGIYECY